MTTRILCAFCVIAIPLLAQPAGIERSGNEMGEMVTDRPDFTESSEVVGRDVAQWEMGSVLEFDRAAGTRTLSLGTPLLRWGVSKRVEMRIAGDGHITEFSRGQKQRDDRDSVLVPNEEGQHV